MNFDPVPFPVVPSFLLWLLVFGGLVAIVAAVSLVAALASAGGRGAVRFADEVGAMFSDLVSISPRRVFALGQLTIREAVRRRALLVGVVFAILFMFAGWFLSSSNLQPEFQVKVYITFVLWTISWLILPVVLLLACWGIPEDIRVRSIHTAVTKPARRLEIVLGRMFGFSVIGLAVLAVMGITGYFWITRMLPAEAQPYLVCRQPVFGDLKFTDRDGNDAASGINTGDVWMFHSYIEGATEARAIWEFAGMDAGVLDGEGNLHIENRFQGFRSYKGDMKRSIYFQYTFVNPETNLRVPYKLLTINEGRGRTDAIPRKVIPLGTSDAEAGKTYDLVDDLISKDGRMIVEVACMDSGQYIGMARPDLFVRTPDAPFEAGYAKAIGCIGLMVLLLVFVGVAVSTFVKGPVATFLTFSAFIVAQTARDFMGKIVGDPLAIEKARKYSGQLEMTRLEGGGVFESIYRLVMHLNPTTPLPEGAATTIMTTIDSGLVSFLWLIYKVLPNLDYFAESLQYLANGFDVRWESAVLPCITVTLAYFIPCVLLGYFALRVRELEAK